MPDPAFAATPTIMRGVKFGMRLVPGSTVPAFEECLVLNLDELDALQGARRQPVEGDAVSLMQLMLGFRLGRDERDLPHFYHDLLKADPDNAEALGNSYIDEDDLRGSMIYRWKMLEGEAPELVEIKPDPRVHAQPGDVTRYEVISPLMDTRQPIFVVLPLSKSYVTLLAKNKWLRKVSGERPSFTIEQRLHHLEPLIFQVVKRNNLLERALREAKVPQELGRLRLMTLLLDKMEEVGMGSTSTLMDSKLPDNDELWQLELMRRLTTHLYNAAHESLVIFPQIHSSTAKERDAAAKTLMGALADDELYADIEKLLEHLGDAPESIVDLLVDVLSEAATALLHTRVADTFMKEYMEPMLHAFATKAPSLPEFPYTGQGLEISSPRKNIFELIASGEDIYGKFKKTVTVLGKTAGTFYLIKLNKLHHRGKARAFYLAWSHSFLSRAAGFDQKKSQRLAKALFTPDNQRRMDLIIEETREGFGKTPFSHKAFLAWETLASAAKLVSAFQDHQKDPELIKSWAEVVDASLGVVGAGKDLAERFLKIRKGSGLAKGMDIGGKALGAVTIAVAIWTTHVKMEKAHERGDMDASQDALIGGMLAIVGGVAALMGAGPVGLAIVAIGLLYELGKYIDSEFLTEPTETWFRTVMKQVGETPFGRKRWLEPEKFKFNGGVDDPARKGFRIAIKGLTVYVTSGVVRTDLLPALKLKSSDNLLYGNDPAWWPLVDVEGSDRLASHSMANELKGMGFNRDSVKALLPDLDPKHLNEFFPLV